MKIFGVDIGFGDVKAVIGDETGIKNVFKFPSVVGMVEKNEMVNDERLIPYLEKYFYVGEDALHLPTDTIVIFHKGEINETYNIGGFNEWKNIDIVRLVVRTVDRLLGRAEGEDLDLITYVTDRAGHDLRYAIDSTKLKEELGWEPSLQFEEGIEKTVRWYLDNEEWMDNITSGEYEKYYEQMYTQR